MARTGKGILDGFRGSIGQTTGSKDKGKSVIRSKPKNVTKTQTIEYLRAQYKFKNYWTYWNRTSTPEMKIFYTNLNRKKTYLNNFISRFKTTNFAILSYRDLPLFDNLIPTGWFFDIRVHMIQAGMRCRLVVNHTNRPAWVTDDMKIELKWGNCDTSLSNEFEVIILNTNVNIDIQRIFAHKIPSLIICQATFTDSTGKYLSYTRLYHWFREPII